MIYSLRDMTWLFLLYSFVGWCIEVCYAAIRRKKFVNRGFVSSPLCPIYGFGAVLFCLFLPELTGNLFFLFLGGMILATLLEYSTGMLMEKIFNKKLWNYSKIRFNLGGYVCLRYSLLWGLLAALTMLYVNPFLCGIFDKIPHTLSTILLWIAAGILLLDFVTTAMAVRGMKVNVKQLSSLSEGIRHTSHLLENRLTAAVQKRMIKSFPSISRESLENSLRERKAKKERAVFAEGCSFYKLVSLFFIGAFLGDITETIFCLITTGRLMSRSSVIYGPFSIVWGLGCSFLTLFLYRYRNKNDRHIFLAGTLLGGAYEYICSVFTELVFGTIFWDYSGFAFNLGGRINLLYCFFWGIAAVIWLKLIYPQISKLIEKIPKRTGTIVFNCLIVFMVADMAISSLALYRYTERQSEAVTAWEENSDENDSGDGLSVLNDFLDRHYNDDRMEKIYPNAKFVN